MNQKPGTYVTFNSGNALAQASTYATNPPQSPLLESLSMSHTGAIDAAAQLANRLTALADRLLGSRPQAEAEKESVADQSAAIAQLEANVSRLRQCLARASDEVLRLERL